MASTWKYQPRLGRLTARLPMGDGYGNVCLSDLLAIEHMSRHHHLESNMHLVQFFFLRFAKDCEGCWWMWKSTLICNFALLIILKVCFFYSVASPSSQTPVYWVWRFKLPHPKQHFVGPKCDIVCSQTFNKKCVWMSLCSARHGTWHLTIRVMCDCVCVSFTLSL